jgi:hypothetical protein
MSMAALRLPRRSRGGGNGSLFFIAVAVHLFYYRRGAVAIFYFPSRRGRCSAAMDISGTESETDAPIE